jgi:cell division protein FtsQ
MKLARAILKIVLCIGIIVVVVVAAIAMKGRRCEAIEVAFMPKNSAAILTQSDVQKLLAQNHITYLNKKVKEVEPDKISMLLQQHPYVDEVAGVYFSGATLRIDLKLKQPILRLYPRQGSQYLMDDKGRLLPCLPTMQERLLIANGAISQEYRAGLTDTCNATLRQLYVVASAINRNPFLKAQISQLYITGDPNSPIEMVPVMGNQTILLGDTSNLESKLNTLQTVYKEGVSYMGFDKYAQLDLRFKNRVVAKKR